MLQRFKKRKPCCPNVHNAIQRGVLTRAEDRICGDKKDALQQAFRTRQPPTKEFIESIRACRKAADEKATKTAPKEYDELKLCLLLKGNSFMNCREERAAFEKRIDAGCCNEKCKEWID